MANETTIERALVRTVVRQGGAAYKFTSPARRGVPDRLVVLPGGRIVFVEVKAPGGRLSKLQEIEIARLRGLGCEVRIVWSADEVEGALR